VPVDLPERDDDARRREASEPAFVVAAPILGWLIYLAATAAIKALLVELEFTAPIPHIALELFFALVGGYSAAFIAGHREAEHAFVMGFLSVITAIAITVRFPRAVPEWYDPLAFTMTIPIAVLGGVIRAKAKPRGA